ncbi:OmpA family protein [Thalassovita taeanensis]|uniref:Outer membrane protein OmpA n=1 Tax=Thalassovita taeanensis TaxID=657014 RepID=A0A1H9C8I2_9RHOB|nr:OmpA family protein [Thalassovita taeanensis]SEP97575.1 Outer membrane protein OmpA [Thalassovita taeanensis]
MITTRVSKAALLLAGASLLTVTACTDPSQVGGTNPNQNTQQGAILGGVLGAVTGAMVSKDEGKGAVIGGLLGAGIGAGIGYNIDKQEAELRQSLDSNVQITNTGDRLIVTMPQDILFATDSTYVQPILQDDLRAVAASLNRYPDSRVQVVGHTDNTGSAAYNLDLSQRRASSVSSILINSGVSANRVQTIGRGEDQPIATNLTPQGRAQNRRVDIVILPN